MGCPRPRRSSPKTFPVCPVNQQFPSARHGCSRVPSITKSVTAPVSRATLRRKSYSCRRMQRALFDSAGPESITTSMDDRTTETALSLTKFGVGQPVRRSEDPTLVRGQGRYTDDVSQPNQAYAVMVRSRDAHGVIRSIDTADAKAMPGVLAVCTAADLTGYGPLKCGLPLKNRDGSPIRYTPRPALAGDKVRFVGDPVACVIAETVAQAKDAAESVTLDIEPLPAVLKPSEAVKPGAPLVFDEVPNNTALDFHYGDAAKVAEAFAKAK